MLDSATPGITPRAPTIPPARCRTLTQSKRIARGGRNTSKLVNEFKARPKSSFTAIGPMTGHVAELGQPMQHAAQLAGDGAPSGQLARRSDCTTRLVSETGWLFSVRPKLVKWQQCGQSCRRHTSRIGGEADVRDRLCCRLKSPQAGRKRRCGGGQVRRTAAIRRVPEMSWLHQE